MTTAATPSGKRSRRTRRRLIIGIVGVGLAVAATVGWYVSTGPRADTGVAAVRTDDLSTVGKVLVDQRGQVLYLFEPDEPGVVTCTGFCARRWPPLTLAPGQSTPDLGDGVDESLIDLAPGEDGAQVVTYNGSPLYRYSSDDIGEATGHDEDLNGGRWYAITPEGEQAP